MNIVDRIISPNLWDEKYTVSGGFIYSSFIKIDVNANIYIKAPSYCTIYFYSEDKVQNAPPISNIQNTSFNVYSNTAYIRFSITGTVYNHNICINESNPSINGKYFPYIMYKRYDIVDKIYYQQVEYIESTGTQYIDSGYYTNENTMVYMKYSNPILENKNWFGGSIIPDESFIFNTYGNTKIEISYGSSSWKMIPLNTTINTIYEVEFNKDHKIYLNNNEIWNLSNYLKTIDTKTLTIFVRNGGTGFIKGKLYAFKIYDNNNLVRNFIPCYRKTDNVIGLYDTVNNRFYINKGTGTFLKGPDVNNSINGYGRLKIGG